MSSDLGPIPDSEQQSKSIDMPKSDMTKKDTDTKENVNSKSVDVSDPDSCEKGKSLPEPIRVGKDIPRLPPIDMAELTSILQGPNMPSQKLMKEVTEKIKLKNDESGSDDGSVSGGGGVGIRGILDCILEVSLFHQDSDDDSDTEGDEIFIRELPCRFCKKIFGSTMTLNTHVLMTHSQEDPSVLNVRNQSGRKEKLSPLGRSRSIEAKEKESSMGNRKRSSVGLQESTKIAKDDHKKSRSRHSSKEQTSKVGDNKEEGKPQEQSCLPRASVVDVSKTATTTSSQKTTRQSSCQDQGTDAKKCDLKSSAPPELCSPLEQEKNSPSKKSKRKSSVLSKDVSSASDLPAPITKKAKRSRNQSGDSNGKKDSPVQLRRSSRRK